MVMPFGAADLEKLKNFVDFVIANPTILNMPQMKFVKDFIEKFGGTIPAGDFKMPEGGKCPFGGSSGSSTNTSTGGAGENVKSEPPTAPNASDSDDEEMEEESEESEVELDMEGVIEGDTDPSQPMGDSSKTPSEEDVDKAGEMRSQAAAAYSEQKFEETIDFYTKAIELNPGNALFHAKRGQAFLKLKKPNACIRDCDKALELNCDSAAAYKFRGRAHRLLGNWASAAKDLRQACKLDFDEEADEWLREVQPNAKKIEQHNIRQERKKLERLRKQQEAATRKARKQQKKQQQSGASFGGSAGAGAGPGAGGFPGGFPGFPGGAGAGGPGGINMADILSGMQDPEVAAALKDIATNPANIEKYKNNPKIAKLIDVVKGMADKSDGGFPGFPGAGGGFPGAGGFPGFPGAGGAAPTPQAEAPPKAAPKKPDFTDDGLD